MFLRQFAKKIYPGIIHYKDDLKCRRKRKQISITQVNLISVMKQAKKKLTFNNLNKPSRSIKNWLPSSFYFLFLAFLKPVAG